MASNNPRVGLVCVGSELLRGKINTHSSTLARRLASVGLDLSEEHTVSDGVSAIAQAIRRALDQNDVVIATGGLGPTFDDLTREASANATGRSLKLSPPLLRDIRTKFKRARYRMPPDNARQAYLLEGARPIPNSVGTAFGQWLDVRNGKTLILLPGPPRELIPMVEKYLLPSLRKRFKTAPRAESHLHFVGVAESIVDQKIRPIIAREEKRGSRVQFTILAHLGLVDFDIFVSAKTQAVAKKTIARIESVIRRAVGTPWYGSNGDYPLEKVVGTLLRKKRATLATAESCTGGLLAGRLTDIPGSSDYLVEGLVTYSDAAKIRELAVAPELLKKHGAVSQPVALAMAKGIRSRARTTYGVGITGIAGPGGGTAKKPVGLVYIAIATPRGTTGKEYQFRGDRYAVRDRSVVAALDLLRTSLL